MWQPNLDQGCKKAQGVESLLNMKSDTDGSLDEQQGVDARTRLIEASIDPASWTIAQVRATAPHASSAAISGRQADAMHQRIPIVTPTTTIAYARSRSTPNQHEPLVRLSEWRSKAKRVNVSAVRPILQGGIDTRQQGSAR